MHFCRVLGPRQHGSVLIGGPSLVQRPRKCWQLALPKLGVTVVFGTPSFCDWLCNQCCHHGQLLAWGSLQSGPSATSAANQLVQRRLGPLQPSVVVRWGCD